MGKLEGWLDDGDNSLMISLAVSTEYRRVTDRRTDRRTSCDIIARAVKTIGISNYSALLFHTYVRHVHRIQHVTVSIQARYGTYCLIRMDQQCYIRYYWHIECHQSYIFFGHFQHEFTQRL